MAGPPQEDSVEAGAAPARPSRPRRQRGRPTLQTVSSGDTVWFRYTAHQWMRGRVVSFGRRGLRVEVIGGQLPRTVALSWEDVHWYQRRDT